MKLSILGRTIVLPEEVTVTIERDEDGQPVVVVEDGQPVVVVEDGDSGVPGVLPGGDWMQYFATPAADARALVDFMVQPNAILDDIVFAEADGFPDPEFDDEPDQCECEICEADRRGTPVGPLQLRLRDVRDNREREAEHLIRSLVALHLDTTLPALLAEADRTQLELLLDGLRAGQYGATVVIEPRD